MEKMFKGLKIIGIADLVFGSLFLVYIFYGSVSLIFDFRKYSIGVNTFCLAMLISVLFIGVWLIKLGFSTLSLNYKSTNGNIIFAFFGILGSLGTLIFGHSSGNSSYDTIIQLLWLLLLIYSVWVIFYLTRSKVKEQFK